MVLPEDNNTETLPITQLIQLLRALQDSKWVSFCLEVQAQWVRGKGRVQNDQSSYQGQQAQ